MDSINYYKFSVNEEHKTFKVEKSPEKPASALKTLEQIQELIANGYKSEKHPERDLKDTLHSLQKKANKIASRHNEKLSNLNFITKILFSDRIASHREILTAANAFIQETAILAPPKKQIPPKTPAAPELLKRAQSYGYRGYKESEAVQSYIDRFAAEMKDLCRFGYSKYFSRDYAKDFDFSNQTFNFSSLPVTTIICIISNPHFYEKDRYPLLMNCLENLLEAKEPPANPQLIDLKESISEGITQATTNDRKILVSFLLKCADKTFEPEDKQKFQFAFRYSLQHGYFDIADLFMEHGVDVTDQTIITHSRHPSTTFFSPLFSLCMGSTEKDRRVDLLRKFIEQGANFNRQPQQIISPLYSAAVGGFTQGVDLLLEKGADLKELHLYRSAEETLEYFKTDCIIKLIKAGIEFNPHSKTARTLLLCACSNTSDSMESRAREKALIDLLLSKGALKPFIEEKDYIPFYTAIINGFTEAVESLLLFGLDVNLEFPNGETPIELAIEHNAPNILKLLITHKANCNKPLSYPTYEFPPPPARGSIRVRKQYSPLQMATQRGNREIVKILLQAGADPNALFDAAPPLYSAVVNKNEEIYTSLLENQARVDTVYNGKTVFQIAMENRDTAAMKTLLRWGANPHQTFGKKTPLLIALKLKDTELVRLLLDKGADPTQSGSFGKEKTETTPLNFAKESGDKSLFKLLSRAAYGTTLWDRLTDFWESLLMAFKLRR